MPQLTTRGLAKEADIVTNDVEQVQDDTQEVSLKRRFFNTHTLVSFAVAFAILYFLASRTDIDSSKLWADVSGADPLKYLLAMLVYYSNFPIRGARWRMLLHNVGYNRSATTKLPSVAGLSEIILLGWFANCILPAKLGDMYRAYLLKRNANVSISRTFGTILAERIIDMSVLFALMAISALAVLRGRNSGTAISIIEIGLAFMVILAIGLVGMVTMGSHIERLLPSRIQAFYNKFQAGTLGSFKRVPLLASLTIPLWLTEVGRLFFITQALGVQISLPMVIFIALANSLLTALPLTPGGLGVVEAGVTGLLMMDEISYASAVSVAILDRTISYGSLILFGLLLYVFSKKK